MQEKDYNKLKYSQKDVYNIVAKVATGLIIVLLIYARFLNVEVDVQELKTEHKNEIEDLQTQINYIKENHEEDKGSMYRHVAEKENEMTGRLNRKTDRIEKIVDINKNDIKKTTERIIVLETTE